MGYIMGPTMDRTSTRSLVSGLTLTLGFSAIGTSAAIGISTAIGTSAMIGTSATIEISTVIGTSMEGIVEEPVIAATVAPTVGG